MFLDGSFLVMFLLQVLLILLNAVFACAEIAIISMNDSKLAKLAAKGDKRAIRLARLTSQPARFLATIQVAITLSGFLGSAFAAENFSDGIVTWLIGLGIGISESTLDVIAVLVITIILSYFTLVFGELVPKRIAMRKAESLALGLSALISGIAKIFAPIVWFLTVSTNGILRLLRIDPNAEEDDVSEEEIRMMVDVGSEKGTIDHQEKEFIQNVFEFDDISADEIATHRTDINLLWLDDSIEEWDKIIHYSRHTLYPVCKETVDNVVGVLNAKDYFRIETKTHDTVMERAVKPAYFVPESVKADVLFRNMKQNHCNMAIVLDEYGGMTGIVTMHDLIEQLVGKLGNEGTPEELMPSIEKIGECTWRVHGSVPLEEVSQKLGVTLPCEEYDTFNGLIFDALGSIPQDGSVVEVTTAGLVIKVLNLKDHQVEQAIVSVQKCSHEEEEESTH